MERNIAQIEFFHEGPYPYIKTIVRLYDNGALTKLAHDLIALRVKTEKLANILTEGPQPVCAWRKRLHREAYAKCRETEEDIRAQSIALVSETIASSGELGMRLFGNYFRKVAEREADWVMKRCIHGSYNLWLFILSPSDDLLAKDIRLLPSLRYVQVSTG